MKEMPPPVVTGIGTAMTEHQNKQSGAQHLKTNKHTNKKKRQKSKTEKCKSNFAQRRNLL